MPFKKHFCFYGFICDGLVQVSASAYSKTTKLSLKMKNASIESVLNQIEDQSEFQFLFSKSGINTAQKVNIDANNVQNRIHP